MKNPCRIFLGPEIGEKQEAVDEFFKQFAAETGGGSSSMPERTLYYAGEIPVPRMVSVMRNGSLFSEARFFIIKNAELLDKDKDADQLVSFLASPAEGTALVLVSNENKLSKTIENAVPANCRRVFYELFENRKQKWVEDFFRRQGFGIAQAAIETILEMTENNTEALRRDCSRLCLFLDKGKQVGSADIEKWLSHTREESAFTLFSRIAAGDFSRCLESLRSLLDAKESPQSILAGLAWCFRKLRDYLKLFEAGVRDDFEYKKIGVSSPQAKKDYAEASKRYNSEKAESCIALTAKYDILTREVSSFPALILMDNYLHSVWLLGR